MQDVSLQLTSIKALFHITSLPCFTSSHSPPGLVLPTHPSLFHPPLALGLYPIPRKLIFIFINSKKYFPFSLSPEKMLPLYCLTCLGPASSSMSRPSSLTVSWEVQLQLPPKIFGSPCFVLPAPLPSCHPLRTPQHLTLGVHLIPWTLC